MGCSAEELFPDGFSKGFVPDLQSCRVGRFRIGAGYIAKLILSVSRGLEYDLSNLLWCRVRLHLRRVRDRTHDSVQHGVVGGMSADIERAREEVCSHATRLDDLQSDSELVQLEGHALAPALECPFRCVVHR